MATFSLQTLERLTVCEVRGAVTGVEVLDAIRRAPAPTPLVLWDLREADLSGLSAEDIRAAATLVHAQREEHCPRGRIALLTSTELSYGLARMFATLQSLRGSPVPCGAFRVEDEAMSWLERDEADGPDEVVLATA